MCRVIAVGSLEGSAMRYLTDNGGLSGPGVVFHKVKGSPAEDDRLFQNQVMRRKPLRTPRYGLRPSIKLTLSREWE